MWRRSIIGLLLGTLPLLADGLTWESTRLNIPAEPLADRVVGHFRFTNRGSVPIEIGAIRTSCGCTTARLERHTYAPGESGEIVATLVIGTSLGHLGKEIYVEWQDPGEHHATLIIETDIPEYARFEPGYAFWRQGDALTPRTLRLAVLWKDPIRMTAIATTNPDIAAELRTIEEGRLYEVVLTPASTKGTIYSSISIQSDWPSERPLTFKTFGRVMGQRNGSPPPSRWERLWRWFLELIA